MNDLSLIERGMLAAVLGVAVISLAYAFWIWKNVTSFPKGSEKMQSIWKAIKLGAEGYLRKQLRTIIIAIIVLTTLLFLSVYIVPPSKEAVAMFGESAVIVVAIGRAIAFIIGALFSTIVGQLGMRVAIEGNIRVTNQAVKGSYNKALTVAYRSGTFTGMLTDGLGLLGGTLIFIIFGKAAPDALLGFGFGGTLVALFMRIGGGIYTKAADVGADLVGKVEKDLPEDDPRNAGVIADLVGDNVGDCAGMAADVFESYEVTIVSALILGLVLVHLTGNNFWIIYPLVVRAIGVLSSIIGTLAVPVWERVKVKFIKAKDAEEAMFRSYELSSLITVFGSLAFAMFYTGEWKLALLNTIGVLLAVFFNPLTSYFTSYNKKPVLEIANSTKTGTATTILSGLGVGMEASVFSIIAIALAIASSVVIYAGHDPIYMLYGVAMIGIGMLSLTGNNVAMDSFGPIADNANGIGEMAGVSKKAWKIMADLDAVGNTTKAITKQVAIASAVIAATSLFFSYVTDVGIVQARLGFEPIKSIRISTLEGIIGFLLGGALPFLFSAYSIKAVAKAANKVVEEVRKQFAIKGVLEGKKTPEYDKVVAITTAAAQKELLTLVAISVSLPLFVGAIFQVEALGAFLAGVILVGQLMAVFMAIAGGALDNTKKFIEDGNLGGKGSFSHKASVEGDTVGDPLKDTAGPALNPMIKVVNLVSLIAAPVIVQYKNKNELLVFGLIMIFILAWAISKTHKESQTTIG
ncbi:MAG: K(+)-insensitive pyrophosphate-energized proton pump [Patescibacteria group bacterium]|nr:MAG: K(+)-insensitive pyrophosphate-energized proton pump [Patescibacteria group bacterium]